jgi:hypothetical protein
MGHTLTDMKSRKIKDRFHKTFADGSVADIEANFEATVWDEENTDSEAFKFVSSVNTTYTVKSNSVLDDLLQALEKCEPRGEEDADEKLDDLTA